MTQRTFLDYIGLKRFLVRLKAIIPTKTSELQNDSGYLTQHNPVDSSLSDTSENAVQNKVVKGALDGKSDTGHTHTASEVSGLSTVATSGSYNDLSNTPTIPTVNNAKLTIQRNGTTVKTFTANASSNVTANITVPTAVSELTNDSGYLTSASSLDSSKLTGTIDIARLPKGALERLVTVANQTARFALTVSDVQLGDTVKQLDTGVMYIVTDETKLSSADGYMEYTAGSATSVPWTGVSGKPSSYTPSSHTHGNVTNDGKLPTASRALISDSSKNITVSSVTDTELGYLSGVTSSVQIQLNGKSASNHVHGNITNDGKVGTTANKPLITGTGGVVQAGSFGTSASTFCEGNDSRLSDARTPVAHTHLTADVTDLLNSDHTWTGNNTYSKTVAIERSTDTGNFLALRNSVAELGSTPASATPITIAYRDKNDENLGYMGVYYDTDGSNHFRLYIRNKFTSGAPSTSGTADYAYFGLKLNADKSREGILKASFRPYDNNTYDLGSSSYQWNNLYAKNYFYNGTQWGLDQANTWTAQNSFNSDLNLNYASTDVDDIVNSVAGSAVLDNFVHMTGNETVSGIKSFPDGIVANVTGSATSATNDGSGNVISTTYGKLGANNTWTNENIFQRQGRACSFKNPVAESGSTTEASTFIAWLDKAGNQIGYINRSTSSSGNDSMRFSLVSKRDANGNPSTSGTKRSCGIDFMLDSSSKYSITPIASEITSLGAYSAPWKSVYAKSYYYNGTAWGLDKRNSWTDDNCLKNPYYALGQTPTVTSGRYLLFSDYYNQNLGWVHHRISSTGVSSVEIAAINKFTNSQLDTNGTAQHAILKLGINSDASTFLQIAATDIVPWPGQTNENIGTSTDKWKSFNGVNPGALSLPDTLGTSGTENVNYFNVIGYLNNTGTLATIPATATYDGWLYINAKDGADSYIIIDDYPSGFGTSVFGNNGLGSSSVGLLCLICPIRAGNAYNVRIKSDGIVSARIYPAQGNV